MMFAAASAGRLQRGLRSIGLAVGPEASRRARGFLSSTALRSGADGTNASAAPDSFYSVDGADDVAAADAAAAQTRPPRVITISRPPRVPATTVAPAEGQWWDDLDAGVTADTGAAAGGSFVRSRAQPRLLVTPA